MLFSRIISLVLRVGELIFAAIVLGIVGHFMDEYEPHGSVEARFIYTIVIASLSILFSLIWMIPFTSTLLHAPTDFILSLAWFAAFGILVNWLNSHNCGSIWAWTGLTNGRFCSRWKSAEAFAFLSAIFWLVSSFLAMWVYHKLRRERAPPGAVADGSSRRHRFFGRSRV